MKIPHVRQFQLFLLTGLAFFFCGLISLYALDDPETPAPKPIQDILNQFFGKGDARTDPESGIAAPLDSNLPFDRDQATILENAAQRERLGQYPEAIAIYQDLLKNPSESVLQTTGDNVITLRWEVHRRLQNLPLEARQLYLRTYSGLAQRTLDAAASTSEIGAVRAVAETYFLTPAGQRAANQLASWHVDRGEFAIAAIWYRRLIDFNSPLAADPVWQYRTKKILAQAHLNTTPEDPQEAAGEDEVVRYLPVKTAEQLKEQWASLNNFFNPPLEDWLYPGGAPHRTGRSQGTLPLLISEWEHSTTDNPQLINQIQQLHADMDVGRTPTIPAMQPIAIGDRIVFRSFRGLVVVHAVTGEVLWETQDSTSPEDLLLQTSNTPTELFPRHVVLNVNALQGPVRIQMNRTLNQDPFINFLFRNSLHGTMTSDGSSLFVVEQNALLPPQVSFNYYSRNTPADSDAFQRDWQANRLSAYDLETGRQLWSVGGPRLSPVVDSPVAGSYFLGPPLADRGELYAVTEQDNAIRLLCLEAETGSLKWSRILSYIDSPIDRDLVRRWWPSQVSISEGVLICPTNNGLIAGVDRESREILWIKRYTELPARNGEGNPRSRGIQAMTNGGTISDRWASTPPIVINNIVIYAPPDLPVLLAYRLADGQQLWRHDGMAQGIYPAGVYEDSLLVVEQKQLVAYGLEEGQILWQKAFRDFSSSSDGEAPAPCGRSVMADQTLMLPMGGNEVWYFDLKSQEFTGKAHVGSPNTRLGNLIMSRGRFLSAAVDRVALFSPKQVVEQQIRTELAQNPRAPRAHLQQTRIEMLEQRYQGAYDSLRQINPSDLTPSQQSEYRGLYRSVLQGLVAEESVNPDELFALWETFLDTDNDRRTYLRLLAAYHHQHREYEQALLQLAQLAGLVDDQLVTEQDDPTLQIRQDVWLHKRMFQLWKASSGKASSLMTETVREASDQALESGNLPQMLLAAQIYGFHPEAETLLLTLIEKGMSERQFAVVEFATNLLSQFEDPALKATALAHRGNLLVEFGLEQDGAYFWNQLSEFPSDLVLLDGSTVAETIAQNRSQLSNTVPPQRTSNWVDFEYEPHQITTSRWTSRTGSVNLDRSSLPFFVQHKFEYDRNENRLYIVERATNQQRDAVPIQRIENMPASNVLPIRIEGHLMIMYCQGTVQCYSVPEKRMLWAIPARSMSGSSGVVSASNMPMKSLQKAKTAASRFRLNQEVREFTPLVYSDDTTIYIYGRNELTACDLYSGQIRWVRRGVSPRAAIYGHQNVLCVIPGNLSYAAVLHCEDGSQVHTDELHKIIESGIQIAGTNVVTITEPNPATQLPLRLPGAEGDAAGEKLRILQGRDLITREILWSEIIQEEDFVGALDDQNLVIVNRNNQLRMLNILTGEVQLETTIDELKISEARELFVYRDRERLFVVANRSATQFTYLSIFNQRMSGTLACVDLNLGQLMWTHESQRRNLILEDLDQMPFVVLASARHERKHELYVGVFEVEILDKVTGQILFSDSLLMQNQVQKLAWDEAKHEIVFDVSNAVQTIRPKQPAKPSSTE